MDKMEFKVERIRHNQKNYEIADMLGITHQALSSKINGRTQFRVDEIEKIAKMWNLSSERICAIFLDGCK